MDMDSKQKLMSKKDVFRCGTCEFISETAKKFVDHYRTDHQLHVKENEAQNYQYLSDNKDDRIIGHMMAELVEANIDISPYDIIQGDLMKFRN